MTISATELRDLEAQRISELRTELERLALDYDVAYALSERAVAIAAVAHVEWREVNEELRRLEYAHTFPAPAAAVQ